MRSLAAVAALLTLAACAASPDGTDNSPSAAPSVATSATPLPTETFAPNDIDSEAAAAYRAALEASQKAMLAVGLTEVWRDDSGTLTLVQVYDPIRKVAATHDFVQRSHDEIDVSLLMPQSLTDELNSLERNDGFDIGSVSSPQPGVFVIENQYADEPYQVRYTVDSDGRIATARVTDGATITGSGVFSYAVTEDGRQALLLLQD
jgi:hypothetical protein